MSTKEAALLAIYALMHVKRNVDGCGGVSQDLKINNKGWPELYNFELAKDLEKYFLQYERALRPLLLTSADPEITKEKFQGELDKLKIRLTRVGEARIKYLEDLRRAEIEYEIARSMEEPEQEEEDESNESL